MKQLKKTLLTLVALLAVTTGAWAQTEITTIPNGDFETWTYDGEDMPNYWNSNATSDGSLAAMSGGKQLKRSTDVRPGSSGQYSCSIWSKSTMGVINIGILTSGRIHFGSMSYADNANYIYSDRDGSNTKNNFTNPCAMPFTGKPTAIKVWVKYVQGGTGYGQYATAKFSATIHGDADYVAYNLAEHDNDDNKALVVASAEQEIAYNNGEWEQLTIPFNYTDNNVVPAYILINAYTNAYPGKGKANDYLYIDDIELEYAAAASSGPEVAWNKATKTGTFTMPGGNVTLEPEYYPQAAVADGGVTAADADARATTDDPLVKVDATKLTGAKKLMYFVSNSGTAPAYDAEGWTDQLPTAEGFTQQGIVYVWYYPVGTDEGVDGATATYSDGDICLQSITARIAAAPTYAVTFAEGVNPEPPAEPEWTASPAADVKKGETVTVTYNGKKKVIGVKAEKKVAAPATPLDNTMTAWTAGKYAVPAGGLTYSAAITVSGDVTLVLTDGETLTLNKGISLASGATLTVEGNGTMNVNGTNESTASTVAGTGMLVLTSGTLNAKGGNGQSMIINSDGGEADFNTGASGGVAINGNVTVNGGTVTATGGNGGNLTITGEDDVMDDHGGNGGAAISGSVTVNTGTWTATNGSNGILTLNPETEPEDGNSAGIGGKAVAGNVTDNR